MSLCQFLRCQEYAEGWALVDGRAMRLCEKHRVDAAVRRTVVTD